VNGRELAGSTFSLLKSRNVGGFESLDGAAGATRARAPRMTRIETAPQGGREAESKALETSATAPRVRLNFSGA
jgi:hypothetical protein